MWYRFTMSSLLYSRSLLSELLHPRWYRLQRRTASLPSEIPESRDMPSMFSIFFRPPVRLCFLQVYIRSWCSALLKSMFGNLCAKNGMSKRFPLNVTMSFAFFITSFKLSSVRSMPFTNWMTSSPV